MAHEISGLLFLGGLCGCTCLLVVLLHFCQCSASFGIVSSPVRIAPMLSSRGDHAISFGMNWYLSGVPVPAEVLDRMMEPRGEEMEDLELAEEGRVRFANDGSTSGNSSSRLLDRGGATGARRGRREKRTGRRVQIDDGPDAHELFEPVDEEFDIQGRGIYGSAWDESVDGSVPLRQLFALRASELDALHIQARSALRETEEGQRMAPLDSSNGAQESNEESSDPLGSSDSGDETGTLSVEDVPVRAAGTLRRSTGRSAIPQLNLRNIQSSV